MSLEIGVSSWLPRSGASNGGGSQGPLALDMTEDAVVLCRSKGDGSVEEILSAALDAPDFSAQIQALQNEASEQDPARRPVTLWLPEAQILLRKMSLGSKQRSPALAEAALRLQSETEHRADELSIDVSVSRDGSPSIVIAALVQTVREAREYAAKWGFVPGPVSTRCHREAFGDRPPVFELTGQKTEGTTGRYLKISAAAAVVAGTGLGGWMYYDSLRERASSPVIPKVTSSVARTFQNPDVSLENGPRELAAVHRDAAYLYDAHAAFVSEPDARIGRHSATLPATTHEVSEIPVAPEASAELAIGAEPVLPSHDVPGDPVAPVSVLGDTRIATAREAIDLIRAESLEQAEPAASAGEPRVEQSVIAEVAPDRGQGVNAAEPGAVLDDDEFAVAMSIPAAIVAGQTEPSSDPQVAQESQPEQDADATEPEDLAAADPNSPLVPKPKPVALTEPEQETESAAESETEGDLADEAETESDVAAASDLNAEDEGANPEASEAGEETSGDSDEALAALTSPQPISRPEHLTAPESQVATRKTKAKPAVAGPSPASVGAAATGPSPKSISAAAAESGLQLDETSLIGVIDASTGRTALVRMPDGDFRKIARGDELDGWVVSSIGRDRMKLTRQGRNRTLNLVSQ